MVAFLGHAQTLFVKVLGAVDEGHILAFAQAKDIVDGLVHTADVVQTLLIMHAHGSFVQPFRKGKGHDIVLYVEGAAAKVAEFVVVGKNAVDGVIFRI